MGDAAPAARPQRPHSLGRGDRIRAGAGVTPAGIETTAVRPEQSLVAVGGDDRIDAEPGAAVGLGVQLDATGGADREGARGAPAVRGLRCAVAPADGMRAAVSRDGVAGDVAPLVVPAVLRPGCAVEAGQLVDTPGLPHRLRRDAVPLRVSLTLLPG